MVEEKILREINCIGKRQRLSLFKGKANWQKAELL